MGGGHETQLWTSDYLGVTGVLCGWGVSHYRPIVRISGLLSSVGRQFSMGLLHFSASCKQRLWLPLLQMTFSRIVFSEQAWKIVIISLWS